MERAIAIRLVIHPINCDFHSVPVYSFVQMPQQQQNSDDDGPGGGSWLGVLSDHSEAEEKNNGALQIIMIIHVFRVGALEKSSSWIGFIIEELSFADGGDS